MAKKTVMTDFGSLKGMINFSEQSSHTQPAAEKDSVCKKPELSLKKSEGVLKVGQKVVLMDSDLRGRIISLGKTVGIELEDGLTIKLAYGQFAVTDDTTIPLSAKVFIGLRLEALSVPSSSSRYESGSCFQPMNAL